MWHRHSASYLYTKISLVRANSICIFRLRCAFCSTDLRKMLGLLPQRGAAYQAGASPRFQEKIEMCAEGASHRMQKKRNGTAWSRPASDGD